MAEERALELKYRPKTFDEVVGCSETVDILRQVAADWNEGKRPYKQVFLLTGPRGTGKTTLGRVLASEVGAAKGDIAEIDTSQFRGVDTAREIKRQVNIRPQGNARVWVIDEAHQMTAAQAEGMLKPLEEPPAHVLFVLCTTNPEKLTATLKSRAANLQTTLPKEKELIKHLKQIARKEEIRIDTEIAEEIAANTMYNIREALILLGQVMTVSDGDPETVKKYIRREAEKRSEGIQLCRQLINGASWKEVAETLKGLDEEPERLRQGVLTYAKSCLLGGKTSAYLVMEAFSEPFYTAPQAQLTMASFEAVQDLKNG